ncbi:hypothetical protein OB920_01710 [Halobacteria archaeon HArc-gm2]|nr:hypothetical protein [Halobacteria archaeon HArc-gm2]
MTSIDDAPSGPGAPVRQSESGDSYVAYETEDGAFVIRDESQPEAWIRSDTVVGLSADGA